LTLYPVSRYNVRSQLNRAGDKMCADFYEQNRKANLDLEQNENRRRIALEELCKQNRALITKRTPHQVASCAALRINDETGVITLSGEFFAKEYQISWPGLEIFDTGNQPASLQTEALWLHYLEKADGHPLAGRWVNLSEIGGLFYQQAFQGYCGDELAAAWQDNIEGLAAKCRLAGGWELKGLGDLAFEWRVLPRLPLCLCYRLPKGTKEAWATMLFDAAANHYVAADVAATIAKRLADSLKPD
jgi:hypothetical protein